MAPSSIEAELFEQFSNNAKHRVDSVRANEKGCTYRPVRTGVSAPKRNGSQEIQINMVGFDYVEREGTTSLVSREWFPGRLKMMSQSCIG